jgi:hypothetical protein
MASLTRNRQAQRNRQRRSAVQLQEYLMPYVRLYPAVAPSLNLLYASPVGSSANQARSGQSAVSNFPVGHVRHVG